MTRPRFAVIAADPWRIPKALLRPAVGLARETQAMARTLPQHGGRGPLVVFLPAGPASGAARLRIYDLADALTGQGWRTQVVPWKLGLGARRRLLQWLRPDVVMMQGARHALNRPAYYPEWPIVYDMDDADFHLDHLRRPVTEAMGQVAGVTAGSRYIADWAQANGAGRVDVVWTGTPVSLRPRPDHTARPPVVAWAQTRPMTYWREAELVAGVMARVADRMPGATLRLYDRRSGDDPGFMDRFAHPGLSVEWHPSCDYDAYLASFDDVSVGLAPLCPETPFSRGKSFGKVLAYLDRMVPVVGSAAGEHEGFFTQATGAISEDPETWVQAIVGLLAHPERRQNMAVEAFAQFQERLSIPSVAARIDQVLRTYTQPAASIAQTRSYDTPTFYDVQSR